MKKYLRHYCEINNLTNLNLLTIASFGLAFLAWKSFNIQLPLNIIGFFYLIILTPLNIAFIFKINRHSLIENFFVASVIYFTIYAPIFFFANYLLEIPFSLKMIFLANIFISLFAIILRGNKPLIKIFPKNNIFQATKSHWPIIAILLLYAIIHLLNFHFYIFMPEWDGYSKLLEIEDAVNFNYLQTSYRGFFTVAIALISQFAKIDPYQIFTFWFICLQVSLPLVAYKLINDFNIKNKTQQFFILLATLSIPVLNMEIDMTRPQNSFILLFPIYIYFIFQALKEKKIQYWILSSLIAFFGLNYHEFFIFIFIFHLLLILIILFQKYFLKARDHQDKIIFGLSLLSSFLLFIVLVLFLQTPFLKYFINASQNIIGHIVQIDHWWWWFLGNYDAGDGIQLGWPGISGAIKFYAYYASPMVMFTLLSFLVLLKKFRQKIPSNAKELFIATVPLIVFLLIYNEILPRLNYIYLPERIWLIIDILAIILLVPVSKAIMDSFTKKHIKIFFVTVCALSLIGIGGSIYIASQKKALTSLEEFEASQWIKENIPLNSYFITQSANGPMIKYFAGRKTLPVPNNFFNGATTDIPQPKSIKELQNQITLNHNKIVEAVNSSAIKSDNNLNNLFAELRNIKKDISNKFKEIEKLQKEGNSQNDYHIYALYSLYKFKGMYAQREWWLKTNFYNANINKLAKKYPLIYNKNEIYIWKIK